MIIAASTIVLFAVVANAVKALSSQTAKAADEITGAIAAPSS
jgi:methyl-accepting chemotaxis protein